MPKSAQGSSGRHPASTIARTTATTRTAERGRRRVQSIQFPFGLRATIETDTGTKSKAASKHILPRRIRRCQAPGEGGLPRGAGSPASEPDCNWIASGVSRVLSRSLVESGGAGRSPDYRPARASMRLRSTYFTRVVAEDCTGPEPEARRHRGKPARTTSLPYMSDAERLLADADSGTTASILLPRPPGEEMGWGVLSTQEPRRSGGSRSGRCPDRTGDLLLVRQALYQLS